MRRLYRLIKDSRRWRNRANEMRAVAAQATDPKVKACTVGAADGYEKLAQLEDTGATAHVETPRGIGTFGVKETTPPF